MTKIPRYSIKKYIILIATSATIGFWIGVSIFGMMGRILGFGCQGVLRMTVLFFPVCLFAVLNGVYKGLVKYYGLSENRQIDKVEDEIVK